MKTATEISSITSHVGEEKAVALVAKAGFDAWVFSMFTLFEYDFASQKVISRNHTLSWNDYPKYARKLVIMFESI